MAEPIRIRAIESGGIIDARILLTHPMESGQRKDAEGKIIPAHYIQQVKMTQGSTVVFEAELGTSVAKNPLLTCQFKGARKGDKLTVSWVDNKGDKRSDEAVID